MPILISSVKMRVGVLDQIFSRTQNSELRTCLFDPSKYIVYIDIIYEWHYPHNYNKYGSGRLPLRQKNVASVEVSSMGWITQSYLKFSKIRGQKRYEEPKNGINYCRSNSRIKLVQNGLKWLNDRFQWNIIITLGQIISGNTEVVSNYGGGRGRLKCFVMVKCSWPPSNA